LAFLGFLTTSGGENHHFTTWIKNGHYCLAL
jgi:hypothetical protein